MKIVYLVNTRMPTERAHGLQVAKTCEALLERGVDVTLFVPQRRNTITENLREYYGLSCDIPVEYVPTLDTVQLGRAGYLLQLLTFTISSLFRLRLRTSSTIYCRDIWTAVLLRMFGNDVVYEDHEPRQRWWYKHALRFIPRKVIVAANMARLYESFGIAKDSYTVAPNGVDLSEFEEVQPSREVWQQLIGLSSNERVILYAGHFYRWKGVYTLLDAAKHLGVGSKVVLVGGTPEDHKKLEIYMQEGEIDNVILHPFVSHTQIITLLKSADVLVLPNTAQEERSSKYTTPIKLFEYMASGAAIVASDIDSFEPYLTDRANAYLVTPDNAQELARGLTTALEDEARQSIAELARKDVQEYTWTKRTETIMGFLAAATAPHAHDE